MQPTGAFCSLQPFLCPRAAVFLILWGSCCQLRPKALYEAYTKVNMRQQSRLIDFISRALRMRYLCVASLHFSRAFFGLHTHFSSDTWRTQCIKIHVQSRNLRYSKERKRNSETHVLISELRVVNCLRSFHEKRKTSKVVGSFQWMLIFMPKLIKRFRKKWKRRYILIWITGKTNIFLGIICFFLCSSLYDEQIIDNPIETKNGNTKDVTFSIQFLCFVQIRISGEGRFIPGSPLFQR